MIHEHRTDKEKEEGRECGVVFIASRVPIKYHLPTRHKATSNPNFHQKTNGDWYPYYYFLNIIEK